MPHAMELEERPALYAFARDVVRRSNARTVLDVACGDGAGTHAIFEGSPEAEVIGVDLDHDLVAAAERFAAPKLRFERGDARKLRFPDSSFDAIVSCHTIEHLTEGDQKIFLAELRRLLRPQGLLVIATPDRDVWALLGIAGQQEDHIRELTQAEFFDVVRGAGFTIEGAFGQQQLQSGSFMTRRVLNFLKHLDVLGVRRMLLGSYLKKIDRTTQPTSPQNAVTALRDGEKASTTVAVARLI